MITSKDFEGAGTFFKTTSNMGGIELVVSEDGSMAAYRTWFGDEAKYCRDWQEIKYTNSGKPYIYCQGRRHFLDEFLRTY